MEKTYTHKECFYSSDICCQQIFDEMEVQLILQS